MYIFRAVSDLQSFLAQQSRSIGFVPTMGALHEGHLSLIRTSLQENQCTVCSIYINPTQFNDPKDFQHYPVTLEKDIELLESAGTHILFLPSTEEIYPHGTKHLKQYAIGYLDTILEGPQRPGHFNGVCNVVHRLLDMVKPQNLYLGEKDFQQCAVIKQMVEQEHLPVQIHTCSTLRHEDGLAMSSRNARLSEEGRKIAGLIYRTLNRIRENLADQSFSTLKEVALKELRDHQFETEYLELADSSKLELISSPLPLKEMVLLIATRLEGIRLIDNLIIPPIDKR